MPSSKSKSTAPILASLQQTWTQLYHTTLPSLAKSRDPAQPHWPVFLDHCFARIILDNAIGITQPWTAVIKAPAVRNMSETQLRVAIELGEKVVSGEADLRELDERSLALRGKKGKVRGNGQGEVEVDKARVEDGQAQGQGQRGEDGVVGDEEVGGVSCGGKKRKGAVADEDEKESRPLKKRKAVGKREAETGTISKYFLPSPEKARKQIESSATIRMTDRSTTTTQQSDHETRAVFVSPSPMPQLHEQSEEAAYLIYQPSPIPSSGDQSRNQVEYGIAPSSLPQKATNPHPVSLSPPSPQLQQSPTARGLHLIATSTTLTPFRREVLSLLCTIPRGHYTTYAAMARHVNLLRSRDINHIQNIKTTQTQTQTQTPAATVPTPPAATTKTCARAIGNAMRNNPFAPLVPCHRVLAADGSIGGFGGSWGAEGEFAGEKRRLLREEGVRFDGRGKAVGRPWEGWGMEMGMEMEIAE